MGIIWGKSGLVEFHNGAAAAGAKAYFFEGGLTTPKTVYEEAAETTAHDNPVLADANGRFPEVHIPYGSYGVKVTTSGGTQLYYHTNIPNADPVEASEDSVDENALLQTGRWMFTTDTGDLAGYVRANGRTIGNSASSATERANDDTEDLFTFLWNKHANGILAVSGGRGASAAADFAANKNIALPDFRNATLVGAGDMGNSDLGQGYGGSFTTGNATTPGSVGGANTHTLTEAQMAAHLHTVSLTSGSGGAHSHAVSGTTSAGSSHAHAVSDNTNAEAAHTHSVPMSLAGVQSGASFNAYIPGSANPVTSGAGASHSHVLLITTGAEAAHTHTFSATSDTGGSHTHSVSGNTGTTGSGTAHNIMQRHVVVTAYIKL